MTKRKRSQSTTSNKKRKVDDSYNNDDLNTIFNNKSQFQGMMKKYWLQRHKLFTKYDEGILLTKELWFSVTPENISKYIAKYIGKQFNNKFTILDTFCGGGGNIVQFLNLNCNVIGVDINPIHLKCTENNSIVYHGENIKGRLKLLKIDWNCINEGTSVNQLKDMKIDCVFGSPPWGGPEYIKTKVYDLETMLLPCGLSKHLQFMKQFSPNIYLFLPKNSNLNQIKLATSLNNYKKVQVIYLNNKDNRIKGILCCWKGNM